MTDIVARLVTRCRHLVNDNTTSITIYNCNGMQIRSKNNTIASRVSIAHRAFTVKLTTLFYNNER